VSTAVGVVRSPQWLRTTPWLTVAALAIPMAAADSFWLISMRGATGEIERAQGPFAHWWQMTLLLVPVVGAAVAAALALARRRFGAAVGSGRALLVTALLVALAGTLVGVLATAVNMGIDYYLQADELRRVAWSHFHAATPAPAGVVASCDATCQAQRATLSVHARALALLAPLVLLTNVVVVGWLVALGGGRLATARFRGRVPSRVTA